MLHPSGSAAEKTRSGVGVGGGWKQQEHSGADGVTQSSPSPLQAGRLISLTAWGRAWVGGGLSRYTGPWCINLGSWRGPHLVLWLILAS